MTRWMIVLGAAILATTASWAGAEGGCCAVKMQTLNEGAGAEMTAQADAKAGCPCCARMKASGMMGQRSDLHALRAADRDRFGRRAQMRQYHMGVMGMPAMMGHGHMAGKCPMMSMGAKGHDMSSSLMGKTPKGTAFGQPFSGAAGARFGGELWR